jgi:hypothetical protein
MCADIGLQSSCITTTFFEEPIIAQGFSLPIISRNDVRSELRKIAEKIREHVMEELGRQWVTFELLLKTSI